MNTNFIEISIKAQENTEPACLKFYNVAEIYVNKLDNKELGKKIISQTDSLLFKFISVSTNLEFLWEIHSLKKDQFKLQEHKAEWKNNLSLIDLMYFENIVIQLRAFIDFAQKLSCLVLNYTKPVDGTKDFYKILKNNESVKARNIEFKFREILSDDSWGGLVKSIRDKVIHYDIVKTKSEFRPTIQGKYYERFCQDLENEMFVFLTELQSILFDRKWISG